MKVIDAKPVFYKVIDNKPFFKSMEKSTKYVANQGYSFNETGITFNQALVQFGGLYGVDGNPPR